MTLFLFTAHGQLFALPGEVVRQVLFPGAHDLTLEADRLHARHAGRRLPVVLLPGTAPADGGTGAGWSTFLHLLLPTGRECLLGVESAGGLVPAPAGEVLPLPAYLFPERRPMYRGLFLRGGEAGLLLRTDALTVPGPSV